MIGAYLLHFLLWLTCRLFPGPTTGMVHDDEEMEEWTGDQYIEGGT